MRLFLNRKVIIFVGFYHTRSSKYNNYALCTMHYALRANGSINWNLQETFGQIANPA